MWSVIVLRRFDLEVLETTLSSYAAEGGRLAESFIAANLREERQGRDGRDPGAFTNRVSDLQSLHRSTRSSAASRSRSVALVS